MSKVLDRWKRDEASRTRWEDFINSPEFDRGIRVLESHATPIIVMGEAQEQTAKRQSFQAGFHTALYLLSKLPEIHFKKVQETIPEWGGLADEEEQRVVDQQQTDQLREILGDG
jgi:hypothetical protein